MFISWIKWLRYPFTFRYSRSGKVIIFGNGRFPARPNSNQNIQYLKLLLHLINYKLRWILKRNTLLKIFLRRLGSQNYVVSVIISVLTEFNEERLIWFNKSSFGVKIFGLTHIYMNTIAIFSVKNSW